MNDEILIVLNRGSVKRALGVHEDHKWEVMNLFIPILQLFRDPKVVAIDIKGVRGTFFNF